mmetsp:Transcript_31823/g.38996  ORF Transcript_31823/g.38996 Transcript_31823/m.38996 type:complete len:562 (+) Transcript_31823:246-1931(+)
MTVCSSRRKREIQECLTETPSVDLWRLRELALKGGFMTDSLRKSAWPKLVGIDTSDESIVRPDLYTFDAEKSDTPSKDEIAQVQRDVRRCHWHIQPTESNLDTSPQKRVPSETATAPASPTPLSQNRTRLNALINTILRDSSGTLKYYQGYHDVAAVTLSALSPSYSRDSLGLAVAVLLRLSQSHFRDAMQPDFESLTTALKITLLPLIAAFDSSIYHHMQKANICEPFFAISWILTWFSHEVKDTRVAKRLFDAFIAAHPLFVVYVSVAMICHPFNREIILNVECDFAEMHNVLSRLPKHSCRTGYDAEEGCYDDNSTVVVRNGRGLEDEDVHVPFQELIDTAISYMRQIPPRKLLQLAKRYHQLRPILKTSKISSITLLQPPPDWALAPTIPNTNNHHIIRHKRHRISSIDINHQHGPYKVTHVELSKGNSDAITASGSGGSGGGDFNGRKMLIWSGVVVIVAIGVAWVWSRRGAATAVDEKPGTVDWLGGGGADSGRNGHEMINDAVGTCRNKPSLCPASDSGKTENNVTTGRKKKWVRAAFQLVRIMLESDAEIVVL